MTQNEINREVARVTGESVECIRQLGFSLVIVPPRRDPPNNVNQNKPIIRHRTKHPYQPLQPTAVAA